MLKNKNKVFDLENVLQMETEIKYYKKLIFETTILVERFWI
jgi:hypothetical protein